MEYKFIVDKENEKQRLDIFLEKQLEFSRSHIKKHIDEKLVFVNGKNVKAGYGLKLNDQIVVNIKKTKTLDLTPQNLQLDIVYEDKDYAVINKPQNMVVHPAVGNYDKTLVNGLLYEIKDLSSINGTIRPGIVHRLDKDTSGLIVIAKNDFAHLNLSKQIQEKTCKRYYLALLEGELKTESGEIKNYLIRDPKNRLKIKVNNVEVGKFAHSIYKVVKRYKGYTLVEFELKTGRTHQIRVHANYIGHSVVGDKLYNSKKDKFNLQGQLLHAYKLEFYKPSNNEFVSYQIDLPDYFKKVLNSLTEY